MAKAIQKCYMCDNPGTTREHVPPYSFFPAEYRANTNLVTVPSCKVHNSDNSLDVEYVRNVIVYDFKTNNVARTHAQDKVLRSFQRNAPLTNRTFHDLREIKIDDQETGVFSIDLNQFKNIMKAIAYGVYFHSFGKTHTGSWKVFGAGLTSATTLEHGHPDPWDSVRQVAAALSYDDVPMPQPEVFRCGIHWEDDTRLTYKFDFYEGFLVYAFIPPSGTVGAGSV